MAGTAFGLPQIASLYDPSIATDQSALDRNMAIAQALRAQGLAPVETAGRQVGGMGYRVSPLEGIAKIVQALSAGSLDKDNDASRSALNQRMVQALKGMDGPSGDSAPAPAAPAGPQMSTPDNPQASVPPPQGQAPAGGGNAFSIANLLRGGMVNDIGGAAMGAAYAKRFEPTDFERTLRAAGIDPQSPGGRQLMQANIAKANNVPNESIRPGGYQRDPLTGKVTQFPQVPIGFKAEQDPQGQFAISPVAGGPQAVAASSTAQAVGPASLDPHPTVDKDGNPQPLQSRAAVLGYGSIPPNAQVPPATQGARDVDRVKILNDELSTTTDPVARAAIQKELANTKNGTAYAAPPLGTEHAQKGLDTAWEGLKAQNREAQNTKSYLQNIVTAAEKGAIVGPGADRREMIQGMLQLAGVKEDVNTNATTQTQLLNKYSNQIVARLGQGGLGTDAARAILQSAYPGQHMNVEAIREAVGNLNGAQDMTMAKTRFLTDAGTKRDTTAYQQKEIAFDQAADPRIWQYKSIRDPAQRKAFIKGVIQQDPTFPDRAAKLEAMGAL